MKPARPPSRLASVTRRGAAILRGRPGMSAAMAIAAALLSACALPEPYSEAEVAVDSVTLATELAQGVEAAPFCLHLRYDNAYFGVASESSAEAWVTEGSCKEPGARRQVDNVRVSWRHDYQDIQATRQCVDTDRCRNHDQHIIEGRNIRCASAQARQGNQTAFVTTDQAYCH